MIWWFAQLKKHFMSNDPNSILQLLLMKSSDSWDTTWGSQSMLFDWLFAKQIKFVLTHPTGSDLEGKKEKRSSCHLKRVRERERQTEGYKKRKEPEIGPRKSLDEIKAWDRRHNKFTRDDRARNEKISQATARAYGMRVPFFSFSLSLSHPE